MRSWSRGGTSGQALAHSKSVHYSTSSYMVMDSQDSPRIMLPPPDGMVIDVQHCVQVWIPVASSAAASAHKLGHPCLANAWTPSDSVAARLRTVLLRRCWWPRRDALLLHPSFDLVLSMQDHASTDGLLPSLRQHGLAGRVNYPATQTRTDSQLSNEELPTSSGPVRRRDIFKHIFMVANVTPGGS